ncbi:helix-turn-helix transcriptional regulator [Streptomyces sp. NPDC059816]|uniref:helix-turn-helix domain-containing protein n=1 Tax=Streptomyces sp. NPDC059816 TaxID=3346960 RepID=UPI0036471B5E
MAAGDLLLCALALDPPLTGTEEKVLDLLRGGPTNAEIATHLGIATRTVKFHVSNLRMKHCGLSRLQLCLLATLRRLDPVVAAAAVGATDQMGTVPRPRVAADLRITPKKLAGGGPAAPGCGRIRRQALSVIVV